MPKLIVNDLANINYTRFPIAVKNGVNCTFATFMVVANQKKSVAFHTLGCKLNFSETSTLSRMLETEGFEKRSFEDTADVYVINTCSVTDNADKECRMLVRRIQRRAPESLVVITGCYAQLKPKEIAEIPGVDLVLGAAEKFNLGRHIADLSKGDSTKISSCDIEEVTGFVSSWSQGDRTRTFLKVQDGCSYNCSFCTIPMARGKSRSDTIDNVLQNAEALAAQGVKEIVLTGVNLGDFADPSPKAVLMPDGGRFLDLIKALDAITGIERYRISSIEPNLLSPEIIEFVGNSRAFMPHFHIPLQSGSNRILGLMRRRYKRELYADRVALIKKIMPHCAIGVDVITGFPGETDEAFRETFSFLHELDVSYLHVFTYSERANTRALELPGIVSHQQRHDRTKTLRNLSYMKQQYFNQQYAGTTRKVLFEAHNKAGMMEGYTDNYIRIQTPYRAEWANRVVDWVV
ncbi:MAG: tRNA (N(6)-L-threonylcarbamoyladenosine(37)-C(2))-methylthiotransferase MtaB [Chitinophagaceae bacterium]|jgi:threonylcarbamoyladenosine tRNA methylthiotransferase MtaB|nr:tRNA (N(6)-L-threonylcarbamoyladenosine(37)-C(2))-methylthiotransferase MtaB [Chitinophagaceae bacterium]